MAMQKGAAKARELLSRSGYGRHSDAGADRSVVRTGVHKHEAHMHPGEPVTKLARGGAANAKGKGKHGVKVNVNIMQPPQAPAMPAMGKPPMMPPAAMPPRPPMAGPPGAGPGMAPPGGPPGLGMPPGRPPGLARGGKVPHMTAGAATGVGREEKVAEYGRKARA